MLRFCLFLLLVSGCLPSQVPLVRRPDTRSFAGFTLDSIKAQRLTSIFADAQPKEGAGCLYGVIDDTLNIRDGDGRPILSLPIRIVRIVHVEQTLILHATDTSITFPVYLEGYVDGCRKAKGLLGVAHSHPRSPISCEHSDVDVYFLFRRTDLLFSLVVCPNDHFEVLWQDGKRLRR